MYSVASTIGANIVLILFAVIACLLAWKWKKKTAGIVLFVIGCAIQTLSIFGQAKAVEYHSVEELQFNSNLGLSVVVAIIGFVVVAMAKKPMDDSQQASSKSSVNPPQAIKNASNKSECLKPEQINASHDFGYCRKCGTPLIQNSSFCRKCGTPISTVSNSNVLIQQQAQPASSSAKAESRKPTAFDDSSTPTLDIDYQNNILPPKIRRAFLFIEDCEWEKADSYLEAALDETPTNAYAYLGKLMIELKVSKISDLIACSEDIKENKNFLKALRFSDKDLSKKLNYILKSKEKSMKSRQKAECQS